MSRILIIEDEPNMVLGLKDSLEHEGYETLVALDGREGIHQALSGEPDLILLDLMLPLVNGLEVCRSLRGQGVQIPIIMLTARGQEIDKVVGLEVGADDYVTKPFSIKELLARVGAHLRRSKRQFVEPETFLFSDVELNFKTYRAAKAGREIDLSVREFEILRYLIKNRDQIVTRDELLDHVWGYKNNPISRTVDTHIAKLRQKIEDSPTDPRHIVTVHRAGYRFIA